MIDGLHFYVSGFWVRVVLTAAFGLLVGHIIAGLVALISACFISRGGKND